MDQPSPVQINLLSYQPQQALIAHRIYLLEPQELQQIRMHLANPENLDTLANPPNPDALANPETR